MTEKQLRLLRRAQMEAALFSRNALRIIAVEESARGPSRQLAEINALVTGKGCLESALNAWEESTL